MSVKLVKRPLPLKLQKIAQDVGLTANAQDASGHLCFEYGVSAEEMVMDEMRTAWQERRLEEILMSRADPVTKVRHIMGLGFGEEVADEIVERYELGQRAPVYYERLDFEPLYEEDPKELTETNQ